MMQSLMMLGLIPASNVMYENTPAPYEDTLLPVLL